MNAHRGAAFRRRHCCAQASDQVVESSVVFLGSELISTPIGPMPLVVKSLPQRLEQELPRFVRPIRRKSGEACDEIGDGSEQSQRPGLEASGEVVGHGDALPPKVAAEPPPRGAVSVERLQTGAAWLMEALEQRDKQLDALQQQVRDGVTCLDAS